MHTPVTLATALTQLGIAFTNHAHAPVFTVAEAQAVNHAIPGAHIKNLFLKDKAGALTLVTALDTCSVPLNPLAKHLGAKGRYSFGSAELLRTTLGVEPGSVTPLALINAPGGSLRVVFDEGIFSHSVVNPHPLTNTATLSLSPADLVKALNAWGHHPLRLDFSKFQTESMPLTA
ncbi:MAG: prolyl-tRNA synthetase associated domain-containing protein [Alphaproteobacteria bacterium]|nr:prolyl-tRNA synthetase associated domain-containing protein [Alphaproteobacteria bacterium]